MRRRLFSVVLFVICCSLTLLPEAWAAGKEQILRSFNDNHGYWGTNPSSALTFDSAGNLYGTTQSGGANHSLCGGYGCGAVFELTRSANGRWSEKLLYSFHGKDGEGPAASLIFDASGNLYGTTSVGGNLKCNNGYGCGTIFELTPGANGRWSKKVLHSFNGSDGFNTYAGVIFDESGNLYGTTLSGGAHGNGTVFELIPDHNGHWTESVLYNFGFDCAGGCNPYAGVIFDTAGNLYGTAANGGAYNHGVVFKLTPGANGQWTETVLHSFEYNNSDGSYPFGNLAFDAAGNLYGTGFGGGTYGGGVIFRMTPGTDGQWSEALLYSFGSGEDGVNPTGNLILDAEGNLYGSTYSGGVHGSICNTYGCGTVFELSPGANGSWSEKILHRFGRGKDGYNPQVGLTIDMTGNLYGTTPLGGMYGFGTVFKITP